MVGTGKPSAFVDCIEEASGPASRQHSSRDWTLEEVLLKTLHLLRRDRGPRQGPPHAGTEPVRQPRAQPRALSHRGSLPVQSTQRGVQFTICVIKHTKHSDCINKTKLQSISRSQAAPGHTSHALRMSHSYYLHNATQYPVLQRWEKPKFSHWFPHPWTFVHFSSQKG